MRNWILLSSLAITSQAQAVEPFALPQASLNPSNNEVFDSRDHPDTVFVIETFFYNCPYCRANAPRVNALAAQYLDDDGVVVLDVGIDRSEAQYRRWLTRTRPNHPVLKDKNRDLVGELGTTGYPSTYVLDCQLNVVWQHAGEWSDAIASEIHEAIADHRCT